MIICLYVYYYLYCIIPYIVHLCLYMYIICLYVYVICLGIVCSYFEERVCGMHVYNSISTY